MDIQNVIDTVVSAQAVQLGNGVATEYFREAAKNIPKITINLAQRDKMFLRNTFGTPVIFTGTQNVTGDHAPIAAMREWCRGQLEASFHISKAKERMLIVGATHREISAYSSNPFIHYYFYGGDNKDYERFVSKGLVRVIENCKRKAAKRDRRINLPHPQSNEATKERPCLGRLKTVGQLIDAWHESGRMPNTIHTEPVQANALVFEDSIYNFTPATLVDLFEKTGAQIGYGTAMMPMELLWPDLPPHRYYKFRHDKGTGMASVTFTRGYSNGYSHKYHSWRMIYANPVISHRGVQLIVEITHRAGPMCVFKIYRGVHRERVVRTIGLTEAEEFVRILDMPKMYDARTDKLILPLRYISVRASEFFDALHYVQTLDDKSVTYLNVMAYVRRRMGGMSLATKEIVAPWELAQADVEAFCLAVVAYAKHLRGTLYKFTDPEELTTASWWQSIKARIRRCIKFTVRLACPLLHAILYRFDLADDLVQFPCAELDQEGYVNRKLDEIGTGPESAEEREALDSMRKKINVGVWMDFANEDDVPECDVCLAVHERIGAQKIKCEAKYESMHTFRLTEAQTADMRNNLRDSDADPVGIREVKKRALEHVPKGAIERQARVHYIRAGPGCGKSYVIKLLADENDLILAPFSKLKSDYEKIISPTGHRYDLPFKTQHRGMETRGFRRIFVDEFTSFPYEYLAAIVYLNAAEEVFLVGDDKQTRIREPDEGLYIGGRVPLDNISCHTLLVNFRNTPDVVALLNKLYGYQMRAFKPMLESGLSIRFIKKAEDTDTEPALRMCFSHASSKAVTEVEGNTVRSNQGKTCKDAKLYVLASDGQTLEEPTLQTVALSRHEGRLTIIMDDSPGAAKFRALIDQGEDWIDTHKEYLTFEDEVVVKPDESDPLISQVLNSLEPANEQSYISKVLFGADSDGARTESSDDEGLFAKTAALIKRQIMRRETRDTDSDSDALTADELDRAASGLEPGQRATIRDERDSGVEVSSGPSVAVSLANIPVAASASDTDRPDKTQFSQEVQRLLARGVHPLIAALVDGVRKSERDEFGNMDALAGSEEDMGLVARWNTGKGVSYNLPRLRGPCTTPRSHLVLRDVKGDGRCCFWTLAYVLGRPDVEREILRREMRCTNYYKMNIMTDLDLVDELKAGSDTWGGVSTLAHAAWVYGVNICMHLEHLPEHTLICGQEGKGIRKVHIFYTGSHYRPYESVVAEPDSGLSDNCLADPASSSPNSGTPPDSGSPPESSEVSRTTSSEHLPMGETSNEPSPRVEDEGVTVKKLEDDAVPKLCACGVKRDFPALVDNDRAAKPSTADKIDQLIPVITARTAEVALMILGGAPCNNARDVPMLTPLVRDNFEVVETCDPRFAKDYKPREITVVSGSFEEMTFQHRHIYVSDMYMTDKVLVGGKYWINNGLSEVVEKYMESNPVDTWGKFVLVHKLTWSTTNIVEMFRVISKAKVVEFLRLRASGRGSEWFLLLADLSEGVKPGRKIYTCCTTAQRVHAVWEHAERCQECRLGRYVATSGSEMPARFRPVGLYPEVRANCIPEVGGTLERIVQVYGKTGRVHGTAISDPVKQRSVSRLQGHLRRLHAAWKGMGRAGGSGATGRPGGLPGPTVAFVSETRSDNVDTVYTGLNSDGRQYLRSNEAFSECVQTWMHDSRQGHSVVPRLPMAPEVKTRTTKPPFDAYLGLIDVLSPAACPGDVTSWNELSGQVIAGEFATGKMYVDQVIMPVNSRRHPLDLTERFRAMGPGLGLHYSAKKPTQTLAVLATRYLNKRQVFPFDQKAKDLARDIVDLWWDEHAKPAWQRPDILTDIDIDLAYAELLRDAQAKGYAERFAGTGGLDSAEGRKVRFHLKSIFKPKLNPDLYKVGQGISAWSVQTLALFCGVFRVLSSAVLKVEKDYVVTDAYWSEEQFLRYLNVVFRSVPAAAKYGVTDGEMFDACQNAFTQEIEKCYLRRLGISEGFIDLYYSFRVKYMILASCASGRADTQKTSGEPGTLFNNGVVSKCISNWLLRGEGPQVIIYKGDDFVKYQCNLEAIPERKAALDEVCALKIRINITDGADFCGLVLEGGYIFPSIVRKANKIVAHRFRTYEHFTEYQESLRDWVRNVERFVPEVVIGCNARMNGMTFEQVQAMYDGIISVSHLNKAQFEKIFSEQSEPSSLPQLDKISGTVVFRF